MTRDMWLGLMRHVLTALGGVMVARGAVDTGTMEMAIGGSVTLAGAIWSIIDKRNRR